VRSDADGLPGVSGLRPIVNAWAVDAPKVSVPSIGWMFLCVGGHEMDELLYFAIFKEGERVPTAAFATIEDAFDWACGRFGTASFSIKAFSLIPGGDEDQRRRLAS
jgi:hypothetical protein